MADLEINKSFNTFQAVSSAGETNTEVANSINCGVGLIETQIKLDTVCFEVEKLQQQLNDLIAQNQQPYIPKTDGGYSEYSSYTNLNADIQEAEELSVFKDNVNEAVYKKYISSFDPNTGEAIDISGIITTDFNAFGGNPDFSDCTVWVPNIEGDGKVFFTLDDVYNDGDDTLKLDANSQSSGGADLFKECCISKGYVYGLFTFDPVTKKYSPKSFSGDLKYQTQNQNIPLCVDPDYVSCEDVSDIKLVLASNQWNGFYLPEDVNGACDVEIKLDSMIRFDADKLLGCALEDNCGIPYIDVNSVYDSGCPNYVVFTDREDIKDRLRKVKKSSEIHSKETDQIHWEYDSAGISVWQTPGLQLEPSQECCEAFGDSATWTDYNNWTNQVSGFGNSANLEFLFGTGNLTEGTISFINELSAIKNEYNNFIKEVEECGVDYQQYEYEECQFDFTQLLTTENVCMLTPPDDCLAYSVILQEYEVSINQMALVQTSLDLCVEEYKLVEGQIKDVDSEITTTKTQISTTKEEIEFITNEYEEKSKTCDEKIKNLQAEVEECEKNIEAITDALTPTPIETDCSVYVQEYKNTQSQLKDVESYCSRQVKQTKELESTSRAQYEQCISSRERELNELSSLYLDLIDLCEACNDIVRQINNLKEKTTSFESLDDQTRYFDTLTKLNSELTECREKEKKLFEKLQRAKNQSTAEQTKEQKQAIVYKTARVASKLEVESTENIYVNGAYNLSKDDLVKLNHQLLVETQICNKRREELEELILQCDEITTTYKEEVEKLNEIIETLSSCLESLVSLKRRLEKILKGLECCLKLDEEAKAILERIKSGDYKNAIGRARECYGAWVKDLNTKYNTYLSTKAQNVIQFMEDAYITATLEVDNTLGTKNNNRITKYTTLKGYEREVWRWNPNNQYGGILLEGSQNGIDVVRESVENELLDREIEPSPTLFEPEWKPIEIKINDDQCQVLKQCYPDKQFFISLTLHNEKNCETCVLIDNIQINVDVNEVSRVFSPENCPSFDLNCYIDDKRSWVFSDGGIRQTVDKRDIINCAPVTSARTITTFGNPQQRYWPELEYRYTDYEVNHSKLVINSKETSFRIDPANAIECDVYGFWQEVDCDECNTLGKCDAGSPITWENPTGGSVTLTGSSCTTYDCNDLIGTLKLYGRRWWKDLYHYFGNKELAYNFSYAELRNTSSKPKAYQKVSKSSYINKKYLDGVKGLDVGIASFFPSSFGIGFDVQTNDCGTDTIEIKDQNGNYTLITEELDGTLGFYNYTGDTGPLCDFTSSVDEKCCIRVSDTINKTFKLEKESYGWSDGACRWRAPEPITFQCDDDCSYYGITQQLVRSITAQTESFEISGTCLETGLPKDVDVFVVYDITSNSSSNIRIQSAHVYRWWVHYVNGGYLSNLGPGDKYEGKLRQYVIWGAQPYKVAHEDWLRLATYIPWDGGFTWTGTNPGRTGPIQSGEYYNEVTDDEGITRSIVDILYDKDPNDPNYYIDPVIKDSNGNPLRMYKTDPRLITEVPSVHREDKPEFIQMLNRDVNRGGIAENYLTAAKTNLQTGEIGNPGVPSSDANSERVFFISMIDETATRYYPDNKAFLGDVSDFGGQPTNAYKADFQRFIDVYTTGYTYFRGYNYSTLGATIKDDAWCDANSNDPYNCKKGQRARIGFALHSYGAIQGEAVDINDFIDIPDKSFDPSVPRGGRTLSAITKTNPYSASTVTGTTRFGENKAGLKHFGWSETHTVGLGRTLEPEQLPNDTIVLVEDTPVPSICVTAATRQLYGPDILCEDTETCVKPLEFFEKNVSEVNIKSDFDDMVIANLINAKNRQVLSGYPTMQLFYHLYLTASRCGAGLTQRLDYGSLFEIMELIGDYWTDIIEQVVPATTIWDGCKNSGKVYRNTIFDQDKFPYRRYVLNYYAAECEINAITRDSIAVKDNLCIEVEEFCLNDDCANEGAELIKDEIRGIRDRMKYLESEITRIDTICKGGYTKSLYE
jgi:hypothetical protein